MICDENPHSGIPVNNKRVIILHVKDPSAQLLMLQKGDADVALNLTPDQLTAINNQTGGGGAPGAVGSIFPAAGDIGNAGGRNTFRGPRDFNIDMSLVKRFKVTERMAVSFRAEVYNIFNNVNFTNPSFTANSATFGKITSTVTSSGFPSYRVMQGALRFDF